MEPSDTSREAAGLQLEALRAMGPARRLEQAVALSETVRRLFENGIRRRHPEYGDRDVFLARARAMLGDPLFRAVYPAEPLLEP